MPSTFPAGSETVFTYGAPLLKFGTGASDEIGHDLSQYGARRVLVVTDAGIVATGLVARVGRSRGWLMPVLTFWASTSSTQMVVLSAPVPVVVGTATSGLSGLEGARPSPTGLLT